MIKKLSEALEGLGLTEDWFEELKAEQETEKIVSENGLLSTTKEDVEDEFNRLDAEFETQDDNDESVIEMGEVSNLMRQVFKQK
jgi:hypothetical protein